MGLYATRRKRKPLEPNISQPVEGRTQANSEQLTSREQEQIPPDLDDGSGIYHALSSAICSQNCSQRQPTYWTIYGIEDKVIETIEKMVDIFCCTLNIPSEKRLRS